MLCAVAMLIGFGWCFGIRRCDRFGAPLQVSWEGYADLPRFIDLAAANGLYVVVRIGPYICGEYFFGGLPVW